MKITRNLMLAAAMTLALAGGAWGQCSPKEVQTLGSPDEKANDRFGWAVAISGDTAIVGAFLADGPKGDIGAAFVYVREHGQWKLQARLTPAQGSSDLRFGYSVAIEADTAVVGAQPGGFAGSAYVFVRTDGQWTEEAKLNAPDQDPGDGFGCAVAVHGGTAAVGSMWDDTPGGQNAGSVSIFERHGDAWIFREKLLASDGGAYDRFGESVAASGASVVVGAPLAYLNNSGAAYVFDGDGDGWIENARLTSPDITADQDFGRSVSIDGDRVLVGAPGGEAVHVFERIQDAWPHVATITAMEGNEGGFGYSVALLGDVALAGVPGDEEARGSVVVVNRVAGAWSEQDRIVAAGGESPDQFGLAVSLGAGFALIGAQGADGPGGELSGLAYSFELNCGPCYADCDGARGLDLFDYLCFINAFNSAEEYADCDGNSEFDLFDFLCYTNAFNAGC